MLIGISKVAQNARCYFAPLNENRFMRLLHVLVHATPPPITVKNITPQLFETPSNVPLKYYFGFLYLFTCTIKLTSEQNEDFIFFYPYLDCFKSSLLN